MTSDWAAKASMCGVSTLYHGGWPYTRQWVSLAKVFPNVYADMAWTYIIGPRMATGLLHEPAEAEDVVLVEDFFKNIEEFDPNEAPPEGGSVQKETPALVE